MNQYQRDILTVPWDKTKELEEFMKGFFGAYAAWALEGCAIGGVFRNTKSLREALSLYCQQFAPYLYEEAKEFIAYLIHEAKMPRNDPFGDQHFIFDTRLRQKYSKIPERNPKILTFVIAHLTQEQYANICGNQFEKIRMRREMINFSMGITVPRPFNRIKP